MNGHIITPEGLEIGSTQDRYLSMPSDWRQLANFFQCDNCDTPIGQQVDHPARGAA